MDYTYNGLGKSVIETDRAVRLNVSGIFPVGPDRKQLPAYQSLQPGRYSAFSFAEIIPDDMACPGYVYGIGILCAFPPGFFR